MPDRAPSEFERIASALERIADAITRRPKPRSRVAIERARAAAVKEATIGKLDRAAARRALSRVGHRP